MYYIYFRCGNTKIIVADIERCVRSCASYALLFAPPNALLPLLLQHAAGSWNRYIINIKFLIDLIMHLKYKLWAFIYLF